MRAGGWDVQAGGHGTWGVGTRGRGDMGRVPPDGRGRGGCWASRSGGCVTWTVPGSAACPATPSPAWTAARPPRDTTSGTARHGRGGTRVSLAWAQRSTVPLPHVPAQARPVLPLAGRYRAPHPHQGLWHPLRRPGVRQRMWGARGNLWGHGRGNPPPTGVSAPPGWEVRDCSHPHQHGGSFHLHRRGELWPFSAPEGWHPPEGLCAPHPNAAPPRARCCATSSCSTS